MPHQAQRPDAQALRTQRAYSSGAVWSQPSLVMNRGVTVNPPDALQHRVTERANAPVTAHRARMERLRACHAPLFERLLAEFASNGDSDFFHPHGFDRSSAIATIDASESGQDEYWLLIDRCAIAYGMLRGWSEGFEVPSLGVAVSPPFRGNGWAYVMMSHLHERARARGARAVRLKVAQRNTRAIKVYQSLGYVFEHHSPSELVGHLRLSI